ncbi:pantothenate kinase [Amanita muscaria]
MHSSALLSLICWGLSLATISVSIPSPKVNTRGAVILSEESPETRDSRGIYLPNYIEPVSHIAVDVGGSLAKVVYFTRSPDPPDFPPFFSIRGVCTPRSSSPSEQLPISTTPPSQAERNGALTPLVLELLTGANITATHLPDNNLLGKSLMEHANKVQHFPGGSLNFERFETDNIHACVEFIQALIERSAKVNGVTIEEMRKGVKIVATGGGAFKFYDLFKDSLKIEVLREEEMECLIEGLKFITPIPDEVYYFSDELMSSMSCPQTHKPAFVRASSDPHVRFESKLTPQPPCLLVNIGSGVSIIKVDEDGKFERVSGSSLGGGTLLGLLSMLTPAKTFDEMLALSERGDHSSVDMLVGDIYGQDSSLLGLESTIIASTFGKVFKKGAEKRQFNPEDISKSLLFAVSNNIGQIAQVHSSINSSFYMNAEKYKLDRIYFGGSFIRGHAATISALSSAIRFWSKGTKRALFLRHEGFLGAIGAWIKNISPLDEE